MDKGVFTLFQRTSPQNISQLQRESLYTEKPGRHHSNEVTQTNIIGNGTNWNHVPFYNNGAQLDALRSQLYFCDILAKPESNHEATSDKLKLEDILQHN